MRGMRRAEVVRSDTPGSRLAAAATPLAEAHRLAEQWVAAIGVDLRDVEMVEPDLARALFGPVLERSVALSNSSRSPRAHQPALRRHRFN